MNHKCSKIILRVEASDIVDKLAIVNSSKKNYNYLLDHNKWNQETKQ